MITISIRWASTGESNTLLVTLVTYLINDGTGIKIQVCLKTKPHYRSKCNPVLPSYLTLTCETKPLGSDFWALSLQMGSMSINKSN